MQDGFAYGFAGNRSSIDGGSANNFQLFDERGALAKLRRLNRSALPPRAGTNHDEIVLFHGSPREYIIDAIA